MSSTEKPFFELQAEDPGCAARAGVIHTAHGDVETPIFMPVGTKGAVKAVQHRELQEIGANIVLGNTYHLYLKPGTELLHKFGGLHKFANQSLPILTDSGGFQIFSLKELRKLSDDGAEFMSHIDGSRHFFSPEIVMEAQRKIGSDIMMVFDECPPYPAEKNYVVNSVRRTLDWERRSLEYWRNHEPYYGYPQYLFAIGQGGVYTDLRHDCINRLIDMDFPGYAIGGVAVGEPTESMYDIVAHSAALLPKQKPRYLMGVGKPENILECIEMGVDMFDCIMPTRNARNGQLFTTGGRINILNARWRDSDTPLDEGLDNYASRNFSRAYLRHLLNVDEIVGLQLASIHNVAFYLWLTRQARQHILAGDYYQWKRDFLARYEAGTREQRG